LQLLRFCADRWAALNNNIKNSHCSNEKKKVKMAEESPDEALTSQSAPNNVQNDETTSYDQIPWPVRPSPGINYDFIVSLYLGGCGLALFFFTLEKQILDPLIIDQEDESDTNEIDNNLGEEGAEKEVDPWKEFAQGMYVVFAPFLLCLPWSLVVRYYWMRDAKFISKGKKED
jgi:hypothetical protein